MPRIRWRLALFRHEADYTGEKANKLSFSHDGWKAFEGEECSHASRRLRADGGQP